VGNLLVGSKQGTRVCALACSRVWHANGWLACCTVCAGEIAALMAHTLGVECVLTGHSLGRNKREHLLKSGTRLEAVQGVLAALSAVLGSLCMLHTSCTCSQ